MNSSSPIIGSPLHVVCADNIPNRLELLHLLLVAGADPNMVIESDEGPPLRPVLAEYIASNEEPCPSIVHLLLRFGAKVTFQSKNKFSIYKISQFSKFVKILKYRKI